MNPLPSPPHLDTVRHLKELPAALGHLLDVVAGRRIVAELEGAREAVEAVAHGHVDGLAEDAVAAVAVADHLGVAAADVEDGGVVGARDQAAHLDVADAVVDGHERLVPQLGQRARHDRHRQQGRWPDSVRIQNRRNNNSNIQFSVIAKRGSVKFHFDSFQSIFISIHLSKAHN